jgi:zinc protease
MIVNKKKAFAAIACLFFLSNAKATELKELVSRSGVKFLFIKDSSSSLVHMKIVFKNSGAAYQEENKEGIPSFYSMTVFCGAGEYSSAQFSDACSDLATRISCDADADNLYFSFTVPTMVLKEAAALFNTVIKSPNFEEDKVKLIQNSIVSHIQNYAANPKEIAFSSIIPSIIFKSHKYENGEFGCSEDLMKLSEKDLKNYKSKFLVIGNAEACVCGNLTEAEAIALVDQIFSGVEIGKPAADNIEDVTPKLSSEIKKYYSKGPQSSVFFALKTERPLSSKRCAALLLNGILGESHAFKARILSKLRTENGLIYNGGVSTVDLKHTSYIFGVLKTDNLKVQNAIDLLKIIIKDLRENGITESELQFIKNNIKGSIAVSLRTSSALCNFYFNRKLLGLGGVTLAETIEKIDNVSLAEVNALAAEILDENNMSIVVIGGGGE